MQVGGSLPIWHYPLRPLCTLALENDQLYTHLALEKSSLRCKTDGIMVKMWAAKINVGG